MLINFKDLLARAILDLPAEIDLSSLVHRAGDSTRYSIKGLYELSDDIASRYIGTSDEVMLRNLHDSIYEVLHGVAAYTTRIKMSDLRPEAIRIRFERRLKNGMEMPEIGYSPEDIELVKKYFSANKT